LRVLFARRVVRSGARVAGERLFHNILGASLKQCVESLPQSNIA
jgi:hypothetical protein